MAIKLHEIGSVKLVITHYWPAIGLLLAGLWTCIGLILAYVGPISAAYGPCKVGLIPILHQKHMDTFTIKIIRILVERYPSLLPPPFLMKTGVSKVL